MHGNAWIRSSLTSDKTFLNTVCSMSRKCERNQTLLTLSSKGKEIGSCGCQWIVGQIYPTSFSSCLLVSHLKDVRSWNLPSLYYQSRSTSTSLSPLSFAEAMRLTLNTKCPPVPSMWTTQCSFILKLVNIDWWHSLLPINIPNLGCTCPKCTHTVTTTTIISDHHYQPYRFRAISLDKQLRQKQQWDNSSLYNTIRLAEEKNWSGLLFNCHRKNKIFSTFLALSHRDANVQKKKISEQDWSLIWKK